MYNFVTAINLRHGVIMPEPVRTPRVFSKANFNHEKEFLKLG